MFLKRIELKGFKSFYKSTSIVFDDSLIVIVGPNGSGKSNINDAIKWVLGEASKKALRAEDSKDIIFSGAGNFSKADLAEVSLIFNNEKKIIDIPYNEISVKRRLFRNKKLSEYYINGSQVRKKDVVDLFLDVGLINSDLTIISQQSITQIALAKPDDLRKVINEAAGVGKYQLKRAESKRKLEKIEQDLKIFDVKISDLKDQIEPLESRQEKANKYLDLKKKLNKIELPLIKKILTNSIPERGKLMSLIDELSETKNKLDDKLKLDSSKSIEIQQKLIDLDFNLEKLQSNQLDNLNIEVLSSESDTSLENQIEEANSKIDLQKEMILNNEKKLSELKNEKNSLTLEINNTNLEMDDLRSRISKESYKNEFSRNRILGKGESIILDNKNIFNGINGTVKDVLKPKKDYDVCFSSALKKQVTNIVVENMDVTLKAIKFLKENRYGNAVFASLDKVNGHLIEEDFLKVLEKEDGYKGLLYNFLKFEKKYSGIAKFYAGRTIVFDKIENALKASSFIKGKYKIVTLDGDVVYPGNIVSGGYNDSNKFSFNNTKDINLLKKDLNSFVLKRESMNEKLANVEEKIIFFSKEISILEERKKISENNLSINLQRYKSLNKKDYIFNSGKKLEKSKRKFSFDEIKIEIKRIHHEKRNLQEKSIELKKEEQKNRESWESVIDEVSKATRNLENAENLISKNMIILNRDYKLTYEMLKNDEKIIPFSGKNEEEMNEKRSYYREEIRKLGYVDEEAIEKYNTLKKKYDILVFNSDDLKKSKDNLDEAIEKLNLEMVTQFNEQFKKIRVKFNELFKKLFNGGEGDLKLVEEENVLDSGIIVDAKAPGKKIKSLNLFSGGEKSLMAIALIFAINLSRNLPLLILDEPEAALDESNVNKFAKFSKELNKSSQIIITSHRVGTMEVADNLYGVTMQEKGISSLISVKLSEAEKFIE